MQTITQMNKKLTQMNILFNQNTSNFIYSINLHQTKFSYKDIEDFEILINKIKIQVNQQITNFFNEKINQNSLNYQKKILNYTENSQNAYQQLLNFRKDIQHKTIALKQQEKRKEKLLQYFSKKFYQNSSMKICLNQLKNNVEQNHNQRKKIQRADNLYHKNLMKKSFFPWRTLTYKDGYSNTVIRQTQNDIQSIHQQYASIINILKSKIKDTDELIKVKKAAKGQFTYALNKNIMKAISNLSLQVMSLNQISLKDDQYSHEQSDILMKKIDQIVDQKFRAVRIYKENLLPQQNKDQKRKRKIMFNL